MENSIVFSSNTYQLKRYPKTTDQSLRAYSSAELLILDYVKNKKVKTYHFFNDRFGVFNVVLGAENNKTIWTYASQKKAILQNLTLNNLSVSIDFKTPLDDLHEVDVALLKVPKSLELFELFLHQIYLASNSETEVICGFMTKYFSTSMLKIASKYFDELEQTKAWKKARLLVLKKPKPKVEQKQLINTISFNQIQLKQYYGVFSSGGIDIGTRFFLENLKVPVGELNVLDLASGNGVIATEVIKQNSKAKLTLIDDFNLAIESSKLNISNKNTRFVCDDVLNNLQESSFDLVVSNPPFHFEHENNIEVALNLFRGVGKILVPKGEFWLVANKHLNYKTHLLKVFVNVQLIESNSKFEVLCCFN